jgi:uncharacterized protein YbjT (DUF2867 family)
MKAVVLGSTGLIGSHLVKLLSVSREYSEITTFVRRKSDILPPKIKEIQTDYTNLEDFKEEFNCTSLFIALGTTIKKAGSEEKFREVDYTFVLNSAKLAKQANTQNVLLVSSLGADYNSSIFYSKVKGETERDTSSLGLNCLNIFRPSLLLGDRNEFRPGEKIGEVVSGLFSFAFIGSFKKYKPISAETVAKAMIKTSLSDKTGVYIFESDEISSLV